MKLATALNNNPAVGPRHARHAHLQRRLRAHQLHLLRRVAIHGRLGRGAPLAPVQAAQPRKAYQGRPMLIISVLHNLSLTYLSSLR